MKPRLIVRLAFAGLLTVLSVLAAAADVSAGEAP